MIRITTKGTAYRTYLIDEADADFADDIISSGEVNPIATVFEDDAVVTSSELVELREVS